MTKHMWTDRLCYVGAVGNRFDDLLGTAWRIADFVMDGEKGFEHRFHAMAHRHNTAFRFRAIWATFAEDDQLAALPVNIVTSK